MRTGMKRYISLALCGKASRKVLVHAKAQRRIFKKNIILFTTNFMTLKQGDKAPAFSTIDQDGNKVSLKDFMGKKVVLYFYPKDNTPTCTVEACNLRDNFSLLQQKGVVVLGVSADSARSHKKFEQKHSLPFTLLADEDHTLLDAYGVWAEKKMMGRTYMGILRTTFLINEKGKIDHIIEKVDSKNHTAQIEALWNIK